MGVANRAVGSPVLAPMRSLRERQREERAALILDAAQEIFADKGYYEAAIDEIAALAGVAKGTVYLHFASKEELLIALVERHLTAFLAEIARASGEPLPVRARLERILLDVYTRMQEQRNRVLLELNGRVGLAQVAIAKRPGLEAQIARALERIAALIEEGKVGGELDGAVPTPIMVATFVALVSPSGYEGLLTSGAVSPTELAGHISRTFFPGPPTGAGLGSADDADA